MRYQREVDTVGRMANILIKCPVTGELVNTGMSADPVSFGSSKYSGNVFSPCPGCGGSHTWGSEEAILDS